VGSSLVLGSSVHNALAIYHRSLESNTRVELNQLRDCIRETWRAEIGRKKIEYKDGETSDSLIDQAITLIELYAHGPPPTNIVSIEKRMTVPLHNSDGEILEKPMVAVADLVTRLEGSIHIIEFKTAAKAYSEFEVSSSLQATCYVNAGLEMFGEIATVEYTVLVKTKTPKIQRMKTRRDENDLGRLGDLVETIEQAVEAEAFYPVESTMNCSSCSYRRECVEWKPKRVSDAKEKLVPLNGVRVCWPN